MNERNEIVGDVVSKCEFLSGGGCSFLDVFQAEALWLESQEERGVPPLQGDVGDGCGPSDNGVTFDPGSQHRVNLTPQRSSGLGDDPVRALRCLRHHLQPLLVDGGDTLPDAPRVQRGCGVELRGHLDCDDAVLEEIVVRRRLFAAERCHRTEARQDEAQLEGLRRRPGGAAGDEGSLSPFYVRVVHQKGDLARGPLVHDGVDCFLPRHVRDRLKAYGVALNQGSLTSLGEAGLGFSKGLMLGEAKLTLACC